MEICEEKIMNQIVGSPKGVASVFVKIDDKWAIKLFAYESYRDIAYFNQKEASGYDLGPEVGEKIDFGVDCQYPFGYITEIVEVLISHDDIADCKYGHLYALQQTVEFQSKSIKLREDLYYTTGTKYVDLHPGNIGIKNGHYVLIDFGEEGIVCDGDCDWDDNWDHNNDD